MQSPVLAILAAVVGCLVSLGCRQPQAFKEVTEEVAKGASRTPVGTAMKVLSWESLPVASQQSLNSVSSDASVLLMNDLRYCGRSCPPERIEAHVRSNLTEAALQRARWDPAVQFDLKSGKLKISAVDGEINVYEVAKTAAEEIPQCIAEEVDAKDCAKNVIGGAMSASLAPSS